MAPDADQEIHGNKHHFPKEKEEEEIQRKENADNADLEEQQHHEEFLHARVDARP